jgi:hypothetical protein
VIEEYEKAGTRDEKLEPHLFRVKLYAKMAEIAAAAMRETESRDGTPTKAGYYEELKWCAETVDLKTMGIHNMIRGTLAIPPLESIAVHRSAIDHSAVVATFWSESADKYRSADPDLAALCLFRAKMLMLQLPILRPPIQPYPRHAEALLPLQRRPPSPPGKPPSPQSQSMSDWSELGMTWQSN